MLNTKSFLAVDFGAGSLKLAEFEVNEAGGLRLKQYGFKALGPEGAQETTREATIQKALQELIAEKGIKAKSVNVCAPGFHVFSKFVKLPPVDAGKVKQIIEYEARQNVPFPLEEVVWHYQIMGSTAGGELEVLLVAIKADIVEGLFRVTESAGLHLQLTDVSPAALCNAFRYNYGDLDDCTMLLDIGAKTSNLLFFEKGKMFSRSINLGANAITQDFMAERKDRKLNFKQADEIKIKDGFVSLGGAYEEPENEDAAAISKIARQFMTRLHIQVNQTMQFYKGQQGGSMPVRMFLSGGASIMPYTAQFFSEKLMVPVEYFNPLRNVQFDPNINLEELAHVAHSMGEVVGLGLRNLAHCPVELNLMPESTLKWQRFNQKKPYFIATVFSLVAVIAAMGLLFDKLAQTKAKELERTHGEVEPMQRKSEQFKRAYSDLQKTKKDLDQLATWSEERYYWADVMTELRRILTQTEAGMKARLRTDVGVWVDQFITSAPMLASDQSAMAGMGVVPGVPAAVPTPSPMGSGMSAAEADAFRRRYGVEARGGPPLPAAEAPPVPAPVPAAEVAPVDPNAVAAAPSTAANSNEVSSVTITFRAVSLNRASPSAKTELAFEILKQLQSSPLFDPDEKKTKFSSNISEDEPPGTFTFGVNVGLKRPLKL